MAKKSEGQAVREAFDGPQTEHDELIDQMEARMREEHARGSDASESAAKVSAFIDKTGLNTQAFSWGKTILKKLPKKAVSLPKQVPLESDTSLLHNPLRHSVFIS